MNQVRALREAADFKQEEIAERLGMSPANYSKKEAGSVKFSLPEAKMLADLFETSIEAIFFNEKVSKIEPEGERRSS